MTRAAQLDCSRARRSTSQHGFAELEPLTRQGRGEDEDPRQAWYYDRSHAWFAGFAPAGDPEVVVIVLVEHGGGGGKTAAPIGLQILQEYLGGHGSTQQLYAAQAAHQRALEEGAARRRAGVDGVTPTPTPPTTAPRATPEALETD